MSWVVENLGSLVVGLVVLAIVVAVVALLIRDKKQGKSLHCDTCESCGACAMRDACDLPDKNSDTVK